MLKWYSEAELLEKLQQNEIEEDSPIQSVEDLLVHLEQVSPMMWVTAYVPECQTVHGIHRETLISTGQSHRRTSTPVALLEATGYQTINHVFVSELAALLQMEVASKNRETVELQLFERKRGKFMLRRWQMVEDQPILIAQRG
ncbi:hypothetical protein [Candidatus Enterococcus leclercqii]|uniref:hypothetical protein n=1 Tax=Candidatus Enterococcus leclercqii TaxID=1857218 RepID=UPI00137A0881|nr:hypothetical protein [Enterococcus sp. CU9D]KAF1294191.1 hypothetical protein BAU14_07320 [Enterococcus sp. CU9D]